jgi:hypothetical protein
MTTSEARKRNEEKNGKVVNMRVDSPLKQMAPAPMDSTNPLAEVVQHIDLLIETVKANLVPGDHYAAGTITGLEQAKTMVSLVAWTHELAEVRKPRS